MGGLREPGGTSQSLWGYINKAQDTDFGGKTGTSNNHSDAWFMCVSPNIVVGAWVGGEYRSIHFRTGALGQGSRTALPICGYFIQSLMGDPQFGRYHGRFNKPQDDDITRDMYMCDSYYPAKKTPLLLIAWPLMQTQYFLTVKATPCPRWRSRGKAAPSSLLPVRLGTPTPPMAERAGKGRTTASHAKRL